nr:hypothetical protein [Carnobacterium divergens]
MNQQLVQEPPALTPTFDGLDDLVAPPIADDQNTVVTEALELFGEEMVEVLND